MTPNKAPNARKPRKSAKKRAPRRDPAADIGLGANSIACDQSLDALQADGRLDTPRQKALATAARTIAAQLDHSASNSQMFREYREIWRDLVADADDSDEADDLSDMPSALRDQAKA